MADAPRYPSLFQINSRVWLERLSREKQARRGIELMLDFAPNHTAPDHPWLRTHPGYYVQGSEEALASAPHGNFPARSIRRRPSVPSWLLACASFMTAKGGRPGPSADSSLSRPARSGEPGDRCVLCHSVGGTEADCLSRRRVVADPTTAGLGRQLDLG